MTEFSLGELSESESCLLPSTIHVRGLCLGKLVLDKTTIMNEWMNEWSIYIALYCVLYTQSALQSCVGGVSPQPPPVCSIHLDDATAATGQRRQCAHHTPATGREEREIEPIKWMGIIRRPWLTKASGGNLNEWMNELSIYIALYYVLLYTQSALQSCGGGLFSTTTSVQHPLGWCDGSHRTTAPVRSPHTSYNLPIQYSQFGQDTGVTPLLFTMSVMGFLMTTESQDLGLTSHPKIHLINRVLQVSCPLCVCLLNIKANLCVFRLMC